MVPQPARGALLVKGKVLEAGAALMGLLGFVASFAGFLRRTDEVRDVDPGVDPGARPT